MFLRAYLFWQWAYLAASTSTWYWAAILYAFQWGGFCHAIPVFSRMNGLATQSAR